MACASGSSPRVWGIQQLESDERQRLRFIPTRVGNTVSRLRHFSPRSVHPHACGEYDKQAGRRLVPYGSSPRVWGIQSLCRMGEPLARFIPTRVGNTQRWHGLGCYHPVHPHACGEYRLKRQREHHQRGSSPRVWGILQSRRGGVPRWRFIPTRVGNTMLARTCRHQPAVHPHACGEYACNPTIGRNRCGSSPRVWGILKYSSRCQTMGRFIPTRVGNTKALLNNPLGSTVHPHACGEYAAICYLRAVCDGSSPRVWGIRNGEYHFHGTPRFIPTRVGNTYAGWCLHYRGSVHPHACGEYRSVPKSSRYRVGSSPRVWGIRFAVAGLNVTQRFIPTRVGNTRWEKGTRWRTSVHPHACGEYIMSTHNGEDNPGSSPRVWGIRQHASGAFLFQRFIPTRVGNTLWRKNR